MSVTECVVVVAIILLSAIPRPRSFDLANLKNRPEFVRFRLAPGNPVG